MNDNGFHFKEITAENWLESDTDFLLNGLTAERWIEAAMAPQLNPGVPQEISDLFGLAKGAVVYGWFFRPLAQLGAEQMFRVIEAAVRAKCAQVGAPITKRSKKGKLIATSYQENLNNLVSRRIILAAEQPMWNAARKLRNMWSHPERPSIMAPGFLLGEPRATADKINSLFP